MSIDGNIAVVEVAMPPIPSEQLDPVSRKLGARSYKSARPRARRPAAGVKPPQTGPPAEPPLTLSVPEAGRKYFNLGRNASYQAAERGELPTIKIGKLLRVPVRSLERMLDAATARQIKMEAAE
jgi:hypothetical protein